MSQDNFFEFVLPAVACRKNIENELRVYLSPRVAFELPKLDFFICCTTTVGLYLGLIILLKFHVPGRDFFLQSFAKFHCL